jgi:glutathione S-transferase
LAPRSSPRIPFPPGAELTLLLVQEELKVPYGIKFYDRDSNLRAPKELLDVHPLGKAPVITDGDVTLAESGAIIRAYSTLHSLT